MIALMVVAGIVFSYSVLIFGVFAVDLDFFALLFAGAFLACLGLAAAAARAAWEVFFAIDETPYAMRFRINVNKAAPQQ